LLRPRHRSRDVHRRAGDHPGAARTRARVVDRIDDGARVVRLARTGAWLAAFAALTLAYTFGPMRAAFRPSRAAASNVSLAPVHPLAFFDERTFALAIARAERRPVEPSSGIRAILIPHHWFAADLIVQGMRSLAASVP